MREQRRLELMLRQQDSQLLLLKELEERQYQLLHRQQEMAESQQFRETPPNLMPAEWQEQLALDLVESTRKAERMAELLQLPTPASGTSLTIPSVTRSES